MNPHNQHTTPNLQNNTVHSVLTRINSEHLTPTPRYRYVVREWGIWSLWGVSVLVGALALAVTVYDALSATYSLYEATHDNFWTFMVSVLPYIWLIVFIGMTLAAVWGLRATNRGYRYPTIVILGSSIVCSVAGGLLFHEMGFGYVLDTVLGRQLPPFMYMSMEKKELGNWQSPEQGRLIGMLLPSSEINLDGNSSAATSTVEDDTKGADNTLQFIDVEGQEWTITTSDLRARDQELLTSHSRVRVLGTSTSPTFFHICGVFPWMYERAMAWSEMQHERLAFDEAMNSRHKEVETYVPTSSEEVQEILKEDALCMEVMNRIR